jgi:hypothetical protein
VELAPHLVAERIWARRTTVVAGAVVVLGPSGQVINLDLSGDVRIRDLFVDDPVKFNEGLVPPILESNYCAVYRGSRPKPDGRLIDVPGGNAVGKVLDPVFISTVCCGRVTVIIFSVTDFISGDYLPYTDTPNSCYAGPSSRLTLTHVLRASRSCVT